jgi:ribosomal protein L11 methyltransferase
VRDSRSRAQGDDDSVSVPCLRATVDPDLIDSATIRLEQLGATAIETRDRSTLTPEVDGRVALLAGFADRAARDRALTQVASLPGTVETTPLEIGDDGWSDCWRAFHRPVVLEPIQVTAPWIEPRDGDRRSIVIDPGRAFGTGGHATTLLLLELLEDRASRGRLPAEVLDVGTGSGVLAIAAVALGANRVTAFDNDREAIAAAAKNAARNGVGGKIDLRRADPSDLQSAWPLVLANLELAALEAWAADIARLTAPGGELLLSGLLTDQVDPALALFSGFRDQGRSKRDGWAAVALGRER